MHLQRTAKIEPVPLDPSMCQKFDFKSVVLDLQLLCERCLSQEGGQLLYGIRVLTTRVAAEIVTLGVRDGGRL